ncbi:MAG: MauE/DoxX family redox-associated membrane protein [Acidobacteriota bacterium]
MSLLRHPWTHRILGAALGAVFLYAAHDKVLDPRPLVTIIWGYRLLPPGPINPMAIYMPWLELLVGVAMLTGFKRRAAAMLTTGLLAMFTVALAINAVRGINVACGCFSTSAQDAQNAWLLVLRDLPMLAAAVILWLLPPREPRTQPERAA